MVTSNDSFFLDILDGNGFPDMRLIHRMRERKETIPDIGTYSITDFVDRGFYIYGMQRPLKLSAFRKLTNFPLNYTFYSDRVEFETYYSLNNSDTDPYLIRVDATCTVDHLTLGFPGEHLPLTVARYERSFIRTAGDDEYRAAWFTSMEQRIARRDTVDRYPYSLARTMSVISKAVYSRELWNEHNHPSSTSKVISRRLPGEEELNALSKEITTPRELGRIFYQLLSTRSQTADELSEIVDNVNTIYRLVKDKR